MTAGQAHESGSFEALMDTVKIRRRVATRYEKLAAHDLAMIQQCLRILDPSNRS